jgi:hypothetical protein
VRLKDENISIDHEPKLRRDGGGSDDSKKVHEKLPCRPIFVTLRRFSGTYVRLE